MSPLPSPHLVCEDLSPEELWIDSNLTSDGPPIHEELWIDSILTSDGPPIHDTSRKKDEVFVQHRPCIEDLLQRTTPLTLKLVDPIQTGMNLSSQVWLCTYNDQRVVLKLYQESRRYSDDKPQRGRRPAAEDIESESTAYKHLTHLQGFSLPYSYGFYNFTLPKGEKTVGTVMEYIPGLSLRNFAVTLKENPIELERLWFSALSSLHHLLENGLQHRDVRLDNIIVCVSPDGNLNSVVIDFGCSSIFEGNPTKDHYRTINDLLTDCLAITQFGKAARVWIRDHLNDPMLGGLYDEVPLAEAIHRWKLLQELDEDEYYPVIVLRGT